MIESQIMKRQICRSWMTDVPLIHKISIRSRISRVINEDYVSSHQSSWKIAINLQNPASNQIGKISHNISYI